MVAHKTVFFINGFNGRRKAVTKADGVPDAKPDSSQGRREGRILAHARTILKRYGHPFWIDPDDRADAKLGLHIACPALAYDKCV